MRPRPSAALAAASVAAVLALGTPAPASAEVAGDWAGWAPVTGAARAYGTSVTLPGLGGPVATVTSTASSATLVSGASTWFGAASPPGTVFGPSRDRAYLNQSPRANAADQPAVTTYAFDEPPAVGWGLVLGDVDADEAVVSAVGADGAPLTAAQLGFQGAGPDGTSGFNLCGTTPRPGGLCAAPVPTDVPTWFPGTTTLRGNGAAANTEGASGWFRPTVPVRSLTVAFRWRAGLPIYQTWLAGQTRTVGGVVSAAHCDVTGATVALLDGDTELARVPIGAGGAWSVPGVAARDGLEASLEDVPDGCRPAVVQDVSLPVAGSAQDDPDLDFVIEPAPTVAVTAVLEDTAGRPVPGARLRLVGPEDDPERVPVAISDMDGRVSLPEVPPGVYEARLRPPDDYTVAPRTTRVVVPRRGGELELGFVLERVADTPSSSPSSSASSSPVPVASPPGGASTGVLPAVGAPSGVLLPVGGLLLAAGAALLLAVRRQGARR